VKHTVVERACVGNGRIKETSGEGVGRNFGPCVTGHRGATVCTRLAAVGTFTAPIQSSRLSFESTLYSFRTLGARHGKGSGPKSDRQVRAEKKWAVVWKTREGMPATVSGQSTDCFIHPHCPAPMRSGPANRLGTPPTSALVRQERVRLHSPSSGFNID
jgi:hypothetical protein